MSMMYNHSSTSNVSFDWFTPLRGLLDDVIGKRMERLMRDNPFTYIEACVVLVLTGHTSDQGG